MLESASLRPFRAALSRVLPGIAAEEAADSSVDPTVVLGKACCGCCDHWTVPDALGAEDLHWADPDTVALLDYLGGALKTSRVVVAATDARTRRVQQSWGAWLGYPMRSISG